MLNKIKTLLGISDTSKDTLLTLLINSACEEARHIIHSDNINGLDNIIIDMVIYRFNRLDTMGVNKEGYSGVNFEYSSDYPDNIIRQLKANRRLVIR